MGFELNHAIVHCADKHGAAAFFADLIGAEAPRPSGPFSRDRSINRLNGGRGVYVWDPDGNSYEFFTVDPLVGA